jgi:hypothetical protein
MDGKFHLFDIIVTLISSVYEMLHKKRGKEGGSYTFARSPFMATWPGCTFQNKKTAHPGRSNNF